VRIDSKLLARYFSEECNEKERQAVNERIQSDPAFAKTVKKLQMSINLKEIPSETIDVDALWQQLQQKIIMENAKSFYEEQDTAGIFSRIYRSRRVSQFVRYAAIFIFALSLSYFFSNGFTELPLKQTSSPEFQLAKILNGERQNITLADGSIVTVDAGSELKYFASYKNERHVYLNGEACFNVAPDKNRPFYVHADHAVVRVVGTRFNVRSWDTNPNVVVTVAEGKVAVSRPDSLQQEQTVMLVKGEQSIVPRQGPLTHAANIDVEQYFKWMQNEIHFENSKVSEVVAQLERWYDYRFTFKAPDALKQTISVHIKSANVEEVIRVISVVTDSRVVRNGKQIEFSPKGF
jgi:transmembrane sensor